MKKSTFLLTLMAVIITSVIIYIAKKNNEPELFSPVPYKLDKELMIYKDFKFAMDKSEAAKIKGVYDCTAEVGDDALCLPDQKYDGIDAMVVLRFYYNKLLQVNVSFKYNEKTHLQLFKELNSKYLFLAMKSTIGSFDIVEQKKKIPNKYLDEIQRFEDIALEKGNISYVFLDKENVASLVDNSKSIKELIRKADMKLKEADLYVVNKKDKKLIYVAFLYPKLANDFVARQEKAKKEQNKK